MANRETYFQKAQRRDRAHAAFVDTLTELGDIDEAAAHKVKNLFLRHRIALLDDALGKIRVKAAMFLDHDVIRRAVAM